MKQINWVTAPFLLLTPLAAIVWAPIHVSRHGLDPSALALAAFFVVATGFAITAGYHRHFSHGAYECRRFLKVFYLLFGAAAFQHSLLNWASDHRRHHRSLDDEGDPYDIHRGFFFAHIGWMLVEDGRPQDLSNVEDLAADPWVRFQHDHYVPVATAMCFGLPLAIGFAAGNPWGYLLWAGLVRMVLVHHSTFLVNSLAHTLGKRPYSRAISARDSLVTALLTLGEGYHNFHHRFATDYRNGLRWYQYDPTKWAIRAMETIGWTWDLTRAPREKIVAAELESEAERFLARWKGRSEHAAVVVRERLAEIGAVVERAAARLGELERELFDLRRQWDGRPHPRLDWLKRELRAASVELRQARERWRDALEDLARSASPLPT
jgi:stearoyl-CoA desaturase (Delta-9 desaturase)